MGTAEAEHSGVPHWAADGASSLLCLLKIKLFFFKSIFYKSLKRHPGGELPAS